MTVIEDKYYWTDESRKFGVKAVKVDVKHLRLKVLATGTVIEVKSDYYLIPMSSTEQHIFASGRREVRGSRGSDGSSRSNIIDRHIREWRSGGRKERLPVMKIVREVQAEFPDATEQSIRTIISVRKSGFKTGRLS
jgi:hypothetical protein